MKTYYIGEISKMNNISISTLRYYDKEGLFSNVERTEGGIRMFKDEDINQLNMIECLKSSGMSLKNIKVFFKWCSEGDSTIEERYKMFVERKSEIENQISELQNTLDMINYKCEYYKMAIEEGTLISPRLDALTEKAAKSSAYIRQIVGNIK